MQISWLLFWLDRGVYMRIHESLLIEGTSNFSILCYGLFISSDLEKAYSSAKEFKCNVHKLVDSDWDQGFILAETIVEDYSRVFDKVYSSLKKMISIEGCFVAVCMYDGAFGGVKYLFDDSFSDQTYAFCFPGRDSVICLDEYIISSEEWSSVISRCRKSLQSLTSRSR